jgi:uncharacterized membrane protein YdjX (TVP38/TMEM64 family)
MGTATAERKRIPKTRDVLMRVVPLFLLLALAAIAAYKLGWLDYRHTLERVQGLRRGHSFGGFVIGFTLLVGIGTAIGIPGLPLMVAAGAVFGTLLGAIVSWVGALMSATIGYWVARTVGRDIVTRWVKRFKPVDSAMNDAKHFLGILRLRLIPVLPIGTVNFVGGLAKTNFLAYLAATAIGILPAVTIYNYFADSLVAGVGSGRADAFKSLIIASLLLLALSLMPMIYTRLKSKPLSTDRESVFEKIFTRTGRTRRT